MDVDAKSFFFLEGGGEGVAVDADVDTNVDLR